MALFELNINKFLTGMNAEAGCLFTGMLGLAMGCQESSHLIKFQL